MVEAIVQAIAEGLSYLAVRGIDGIVGKWLAYFTIAWEQVASDASRAAFNSAMGRIKDQSPVKAQAWADWRQRAANTPNSTS
jgi:hypothetical protein